MSLPQTAVRPLGLALGVAADRVLADPRRYHPVAGFGRYATWLEGKLHADSIAAGATYTVLAVGPVVLGAMVLEELGRRRPGLGVLLTAAGTWAVLGGTSLEREGLALARALEAGDLRAARERVPHLCARDPQDLSAPQIARATVESLAENSSDAVVAPLLWGALAGLPGLLGYRAVNTLDAMVGYTSPHYLRFGRVPARLDDAANLLPARATGLLTAAMAPVVAGSPRRALQVMVADGARHPSPNAGHPEAATAGALGLRLGGNNVYAGQVEERPVLGTGRPPDTADVRRTVRLSRAVGLAAAALSVGIAAAGAARARRRRSPR
ncbi:MAG: adenosylcobinamide-phosphate synthase [Actinomycetota bacterium]|nr:adenosylcobinamide-phosphate synthase [Actinomycetota bacterium]